MKQKNKEARNLAKVLALLGQHGVAVDKKEIETSVAAHRISESDKLEGVLASVRRPGDFTYRVCKRPECRAPFGTNYVSVAYCSDNCRIREFEKLTGCTWTPKAPEERWGGEPPLIIPPDVVYRMFEYSKTLLQYAETQGWESPEDIPRPVFHAESVVESETLEADPDSQVETNQPTLLLQPVRKARLSLTLSTPPSVQD